MLCNLVTVASLSVLLLSGLGLTIAKTPKADHEQRADLGRRIVDENIMG
ncbi:hypothetical protein ACFPM2_08430 [Azospirillum picis]|nr:hypothetical protein [Azospirillum picis]